MATKATLINSAGKKVVVDSGSQQAQDYFSQGYQLMVLPVNTFHRQLRQLRLLRLQLLKKLLFTDLTDKRK